MKNFNNAKKLRYRECISFLETLRDEKLAGFEDSDVPNFVMVEFRESVDSVLDELQRLMSGDHTVSAVKVEPLKIKLTERVKKEMVKKNIVSPECFLSPETRPDDWIFLNGLCKMPENLLLSIVKSKRGADWTAKQLEHVDELKWIKDAKTHLKGLKGQRGKVGDTLIYLFKNHRYLFRGKDDHEFMNLANAGVAEWSKAPPNVKRLHKQVKNMNSNLVRKTGGDANVTDN